MATHSSVLAWRIPGMGEPGGLPSMGLHRVGYDWSDLAAAASFHMVIRYLYIFFEAMSVWILCLFLNWFFFVYVSLYSLVLKVFRYFGYCTLIRYMTCKYFLPLCGRKIFIFLIMFFETKRFLILMKCNLLLFSVWLFVLLRNHCLKQGHKGLLLSFLLSFIILVLTFRFLVHVWVKFCLLSEVGIQIHSFAHGNPDFPTLCVDKTILYLLSWHSVKNQLTINVCVCFWTLNSTPLIYVSILRPVPHTVLITIVL